MGTRLDTVRQLLDELIHSDGTRDSQRMIKLERTLEDWLRAHGLADCGPVRIYGQTSMEPHSDFVGHAFLFEAKLAVPLRLTVPGSGRSGVLLCGHPSQGKPAVELEGAWREGTFPSSPGAFGASWPLSGGGQQLSDAAPSTHAGLSAHATAHGAAVPTAPQGPALIRALGQLAAVGGTSPVGLGRLWQGLLTTPGLRQHLVRQHPALSDAEVDRFLHAVGGVIAAAGGEAASQAQSPWTPPASQGARPQPAGWASPPTEPPPWGRTTDQGDGRPEVRGTPDWGQGGGRREASTRPRDDDHDVPAILRGWRPPK